MGRRSRKRSFPVWEKKHRKRAEKLRAQVLKIYLHAFGRIMDAPSPLWEDLRRRTAGVNVPVIRYALDREVTHGQT